MSLVIFTDLDGTLLDPHTYDHSPASTALAELNRREIPLILCSSKTAAEILPLRKQIRNEHPFIVENGGGIYIPKNYFSRLPFSTRGKGSFLVISLGPSYNELRQALDGVAQRCRLSVRGFHQLTAQELADESGLSVGKARKALRREFDLPFRILGATNRVEELEGEIRRRGLSLTRGGRYFHLSGDNDKGRAVAKLIESYRIKYGAHVRTIGLGDSENDLGMLREVDLAVVVPNPYSSAPLEVPAVRLAPAPGPEGWNEAVLSLLREVERDGGVPQ